MPRRGYWAIEDPLHEKYSAVQHVLPSSTSLFTLSVPYHIFDHRDHKKSRCFGPRRVATVAPATSASTNWLAEMLQILAIARLHIPMLFLQVLVVGCSSFRQEPALSIHHRALSI